MAHSYDELVSIFERLGARNPQSWARSEINEGIPQLLSFLVLRGMWRQVIGDGETDWIDAYIKGAEKDPKAPLSGIGLALARLRKAGADPRDLADVVRGMQYETMFAIAYLLEDPFAAIEDVREAIPELNDVVWGLWEEDQEGNPIRRIQGLHESALSTDPTGREMRPR
jgi:hypothetical protein